MFDSTSASSISSSRIRIWASKMAASSAPAVCSARARTCRSRSLAAPIAAWNRAISSTIASSWMMRCRTSGTSHRSRRTGPTTIPGEAGTPTKVRSTGRYFSPNRPEISVAMASTAADSSGPDARRVMVDPHSAASISTPMMLFPFTSRSSRTITMSLANRAAVLTISAAGRACRPFLLAITTTFSAMPSHRRVEDECRQHHDRDPPPFGTSVHPNQQGAPDDGRRHHADDRPPLGAGPDHPPERDGQRHAGQVCPRAGKVAGPDAKQPAAQRRRDPQTGAPPRVDPPCAEPEMTGVVRAEEDRQHHRGAGPEPERREREEGAHREPPGPDEPITDAAQGSAERGSEPLDAVPGDAVQLRARERADGDRGQIRVRVEVAGLARERVAVRRAVGTAGEEPQHGLDAEADARPHQQLVIP